MSQRQHKKIRREITRLAHRDFRAFMKEATTMGMWPRLILCWHILAGVTPR